MMPCAHSPVNVMIVDDSLVFRRFLRRFLSAAPGIQVIAEAGCGEEARQLVQQRRPDVITLDLHMPGQSGIDFLRQTTTPLQIPTIVISSHTQEGASRTIEALEAGAVDVIAKPRGLAPGQPDTTAWEALAERVKAVAYAQVQSPPPVKTIKTSVPVREAAQDWLIALGASTGGVQALGAVLAALPANCPPVAVVQHMPLGFTQAFARRLNHHCAIEVREAQDGDWLRPGLALIAPGGERHMHLRRVGGRLRVVLDAGEAVCFSRPSVDELFLSAAQQAGARVSAAVLTGMGEDGARGLLALRMAGAQTFAQDQASSLIYGMPARAWELGGAIEQVPLDRMAERLLRSVGTTSACAQTTKAKPLFHNTQKGL